MSNVIDITARLTRRAAPATAAARQAEVDAVRANHFTGAKYDRGQDVAELAKRLRADIAAAIKSGELPSGLKCSVRVARYSMGQSVYVTVTACPFAVGNPARKAWIEANPYESFCHAPDDVMPLHSAEAHALLDKLTAMANAYNYDRSDTLTDYFESKFHLIVAFGREVAQ